MASPGTLVICAVLLLRHVLSAEAAQCSGCSTSAGTEGDEASMLQQRRLSAATGVDDVLDMLRSAPACPDGQVKCLVHGGLACIDANGVYGKVCEIPSSPPPPPPDSEFLEVRPKIWTSERNPANGSFTAWRFPLEFSKLALFYRRFGVDVPGDLSSCRPSGCPIIFDFHGSGGNVYTQRAWTKWYEYQAQVGPQKFILITMEGSPDGVMPEDYVLLGNASSTAEWLVERAAWSSTSWNVLGWSAITEPVGSLESCDGNSRSQCFAAAQVPIQAYNCWFSTMMNDPSSCRKTPKEASDATQYPQIMSECGSASQANDWDYVRKVIAFATDSPECRSGAGTESGESWCGDPTRIYFAGQSMGGMSSIQFAAKEGKYAQTPDTQPAAVVACSAGGSRNNDVFLNGEVPAMFIQGSRDPIAVPTVSAGYMRNLTHIQSTAQFKRFASRAPLLSQALQILNMSSPTFVNVSNQHATVEDPVAAVLQADTMWGGALLAGFAEELARQEAVGCPDLHGIPCGIDSDGYMWQTISTSLRNLVGKEVVMKDLEYFRPISKAIDEAAVDLANLRCAYVPGHGPKDKAAEVKFCAFNGEHDWPWNDPNSLKWEHNTGNGKLMHDFVWVDFLRNGTVRRKQAQPE